MEARERGIYAVPKPYVYDRAKKGDVWAKE
jgi:hypothetical protein